MADHENRQPQLVGSYEHGLDGKGRMVLPAKIRARIGETGMIGRLDGCLGLWSLDRFDDVAERILAKAESGEASRDFYRRFMAFAAEVTPDNQGRVVIPQKLRSYAGLTTDVVVTGRGDRSEEHTSELQSLMRISYAVFCLKKKKQHTNKIDSSAI